MTISVQRLHHYTLRCTADEIEELRSFYEGVLGMTAGERPQLRVPGYWMYANGAPLVHLFIDTPGASPANTGFDHLAFLASDLEGSRRFLADRGVEFTEAPVPGWPLHQIFVRDPLGVKLELTFETSQRS
ncbi:VOC family protein [Variovorax sp. OV329]|uniref:VOC family protein n=1 Tax=Variovorax sp. OV329 TaxID=1882825 RepID=UPI0008E0C6F1|nr:VOC family protein [Variovorax sp. OV329]SFM92383.1 Catechol 2,3-dioxygenase [Variovorax sp. OV329]